MTYSWLGLHREHRTKPKYYQTTENITFLCCIAVRKRKNLFAFSFSAQHWDGTNAYIFPHEKDSIVLAYNITAKVLGPILLKWNNFNPTMDK